MITSRNCILVITSRNCILLTTSRNCIFVITSRNCIFVITSRNCIAITHNHVVVTPHIQALGDLFGKQPTLLLRLLFRGNHCHVHLPKGAEIGRFYVIPTLTTFPSNSYSKCSC